MALKNFLRQLFTPAKTLSDKKLPEQFYSNFNYRFQNEFLLIEALTHRSYIRSNGIEGPSNERLEYLGDSVLGVVVAEHLFNKFPDYAEGDLTKMKAMLVNESSLSKAAQECGLNQLVLLSDDEEKSGGRERSSIVSDAMEATIGAIYIDGGLDPARRFIRQTILSHMGEFLSDTDQYNYKGDLLELLQGRGEKTPYYEVKSESGPDHSKTFEIIVHAGEDVTGLGTGSSKKEAEQKAAAEALEKIKKMENNGE